MTRLPLSRFLRRAGVVGLLVALVSALPLRVRAAAAERPPNIVYILADDLGFGDLGVYNPASKIPTPNLDRLAAQGMRFTDAHTPSSVCTPTRYGVMTGRYCWRSDVKRGVVWTYGRMFLDEGRETVGTLLREHGYATAVIGKWHLGLDWALKPGEENRLENADKRVNEQGAVMAMNGRHIDFSQPVTAGPREYGFDYSFILPGSLDIPPYCYVENHRLVGAPTAHTAGHDLDQHSGQAFWRAGDMAPDFDFYDVLPTFTRKSVAYLESRSDRPEPYFLYLPLPGPHTPWVPTAEHLDSAAAGLYGDYVHMVDTEVGKVLAALDRLGQTENTLVIFTSDNGPFWRPTWVGEYNHRAAGPWRGMKGDIWEGGHRVPYLARWPGRIEAGTVSPALTSLTHLLATAADLVGLNNPNAHGEDSYSILPVLRGEADWIKAQPGIMMHSSGGHFAWRQGDWKFIEKRGSGGFTSPTSFKVHPTEPSGQLYHLGVDPGETKNLYYSQPEMREKLRAALEEQRGPWSEE